MQGRQDQDNGRGDKQAIHPKLLSLTETGQHRVLRNPNAGTSTHQAMKEQITQRTSEFRAIPTRPPTMTRIAVTPEMLRAAPRAPRPQNEAVPTHELHKRLLIWSCIFGTLAIIACIVGYLLASGISNSSGPATVVTDFLDGLNTKDYAQAYRDLGPAVTIRLSPNQFAQQAESQDSCYGPVKDYAQVANSTRTSDDNQTYIYTYTITRTLLSKPYQMSITLQKDPDDNTWKVADYGTSLGPNQQGLACHK